MMVKLDSEEQQSLASVDSVLQWKIVNVLDGAWKARALGVATELGVPDLLAQGPRTIGELASATHTHPSSLYRLLRSLAALGLFAELPSGDSELEAKRFQLTECSSYLCSQRKGSLYPIVKLMMSKWNWRTWERFDYSIRTGLPAFDYVQGKAVWEYFQDEPEEYSLLENAFTALSGITNTSILDVYDFSKFGTIVDVGGGHGSLLLSILQTATCARGILFDRQNVVNEARSSFIQALDPGRWECIGGDFLQDSLPNADLYLLKSVLHNWSDEHCIQILKQCRCTMQPVGKILIIESVIPSIQVQVDDVRALMDLEMLLHTVGGQERTEDEYRRLLEQAGLTMTQIIQTSSFYSVIEAIAE